LNQIQKLKQEVKAKEKKCAAADDRIKALLKSLAEKQDEVLISSKLDRFTAAVYGIFEERAQC
jgi:flagellar motility protein MotE (MotC chaperone)